MKEIEFKHTFMEMLTPCDNIPKHDVYIGDYYCSQCKHNKGITYDEEDERKFSEFGPGDYTKYFFVRKGKCLCNFE